jgi:hypothetical protein
MKQKNIELGFLSGASGGAIMSACLGKWKSASKTRDFILSFDADKYMRMEREVETTKGHLISKFFKSLVVLSKTRGSVGERIHKLAKREFGSWDVFTNCDDIAFCVVDTLDLACLSGFDSVFSFKDMREALTLKRKMFPFIEISPYWIKKDGIYRYDINDQHLYKVSHTVIPPYMAILGSFWNPALPKVSIKYIGNNGATNMQMFDGGISDNFAGTVQGKDYKAISCEEVKSREDATSYDDYVYWCNPTTSFNVVRPATDPKTSGFFSFDSVTVNREYEAPATNIFS